MKFLFSINNYLFLLFILSVNVLFAQHESAFGIEVGGSLTNFTGSASSKFDSDFGLLGGFSYKIPLGPRTNFKMGLAYSRKGVRREYDVLPNYEPTSSEKYLKITHNFLEANLVIQYEIIPMGNLYLNGGFFGGYLINTQFDRENLPPSADITPLDKKMDYGISLGVLKKFDMGNQNKMGLELRGNLGLTNLASEGAYADDKLHTQTIYLLLSWEFGKK